MLADLAGRTGLAVLPGLGEREGGRVRVGVLAVLGRGLVRVALLPAGVALGELLVQLPRVQQDERRQLDRAGRRMDGAARSPP